MKGRIMKKFVAGFAFGVTLTLASPLFRAVVIGVKKGVEQGIEKANYQHKIDMMNL